MVECNKEENAKSCPCTYPCDKKGKCCDCIKEHLSARELPACCFDAETEKTYNRSFEKFAELVNAKKV